MKQNRITVLRIHTRRVTSGVIAVTIFLLCACSTEYRMGDVIKADPNATAQTPSVSNPKKNADLEPWGDFGKSWELKKSYIALTAPYYRPLIGFPKTWTKGTGSNIGLSSMLLRVTLS